MRTFLTVVAASAVFFGVSTTASAQLGPCGDIHVEANAMCEVLVEGGCMVMCEPVSFRASCAADLQVMCSGGCTASAEVSCTGGCMADCSARCDVDPGSFDCRVDCTAGLQARCDTQCMGMAGDGEARARCEASCEASFSAECDASCSGTPPMATCEASCQASCDASCTAEANVDCQVDCQSSGYVTCESMLTGGCEAECMAPEGALFCDGQYVDHNGNLEMCIDAIEAAFDIQVDVTATGMASCMGSMCSAEGEIDASCAATPGAPDSTGFGGLALLAGAAVLLRRRRRSA